MIPMSMLSTRRQSSLLCRRRRTSSATSLIGFLVVSSSLSALLLEQTLATTTSSRDVFRRRATTKTSSSLVNKSTIGSIIDDDKLALYVRGGETETTATTTTGSEKLAKKKKKKKKTKKTEPDTSKAKKAIDDAMKEKDVAEVLGNAIRDRADTLRAEDPLLRSIDWSVSSVGRALGASDAVMMSTMQKGGGVQASPTSVIANYFLKSHGGAHLLQSVCSLLATASALGTLMAASKQSPTWTAILLRRTFIFAMIKHLSGLLASASIAAKAIPKIGLGQSRKMMEDIVREPVAQYVFYTAMLLLWSPRTLVAEVSGTGNSVAVTKSVVWWWPRWRWMVTTMLLGPILLREVISNVLVISDILVLWSVGGGGETGAALEQFLKVSQSLVNATMSLLVSPTKWRSADPSERQAILAGLISKLSLAFEGGVGAILVWDLLIVFLQLCFGMGGPRPAWYQALTKMVVVRLYVHYLLTLRRKKYARLATDVRGGAVQFPVWALDALYDPAKALGISASTNGPGDDTVTGNGQAKLDNLSWHQLLSIALGLDGK